MQDTHVGDKGIQKSFRELSSHIPGRALEELSPSLDFSYLVSRCVGTKMTSGQHIVGYLIRWQREITASLAAAKLKHAQCCI